MNDKLSYKDAEVIADFCCEKKFTVQELNSFFLSLKEELLHRENLHKDEHQRLQEEHENFLAFERENLRKRRMDENTFLYNTTKLICGAILILLVVFPFACIGCNYQETQAENQKNAALTQRCPFMLKMACEKDANSQSCAQALKACSQVRYYDQK